MSEVACSEGLRKSLNIRLQNKKPHCPPLLNYSFGYRNPGTHTRCLLNFVINIFTVSMHVCGVMCECVSMCVHTCVMCVMYVCMWVCEHVRCVHARVMCM